MPALFINYLNIIVKVMVKIDKFNKPVLIKT